MTFRQNMNIRFISVAAIALVIGACLNYAAPKLYAKATVQPIGQQLVNSDRNTGAQNSGRDIDINGAEQRVAAEPTPQNYINLSNAYWRAQRYQDCVKAAQKALELEPNFAVAYNNIAAAYGGLGKFDAEIEAANEAIRLVPDFQLAQNNRNWALGQLRWLDENIARLEQLASDVPASVNYLELSKAYYEARRYNDCITASYKALELNPDHAVAYNNICAAYNNLCQWDSAVVAGKAALSIDPDFYLAKNNLGYAMRSNCENVDAPVTQTATNAKPQEVKADAADNNSAPSSEDVSPQAPAATNPIEITLEQSYPNPTSNYAYINFTLSQRSPVKLALFDVMGRQVQSLYDAVADPGAYSIPLDASYLPSGTYGYLLTTPYASLSRSIIILK
jgi:tetratricopeptide (TPR) repeat protein